MAARLPIHVTVASMCSQKKIAMTQEGGVDIYQGVGGAVVGVSVGVTSNGSIVAVGIIISSVAVGG